MNWLRNLIREVIHEENESLRGMITELIATISRRDTELHEQLNNWNTELIAQRVAREEELAELNQRKESNPLRTTRPSWPRMKRQLEERDVRGIIAEQDIASHEVTSARNMTSRMNDEAERVERYWKEKANQNRDL